MNQAEQDVFEAELRRLTPARPPEDFMARLLASRPLLASAPSPAPGTASPRQLEWMSLLFRWLIPAAAVCALALFTWHEALPSRSQPPGQGSGAATPPLKADGVRIDQELVSDFEAVARLPGGEPVRFRCQKWMDRVVLSDKDRGFVVQQQTPRFEVIPVRFETY